MGACIALPSLEEMGRGRGLEWLLSKSWRGQGEGVEWSLDFSHLYVIIYAMTKNINDITIEDLSQVGMHYGYSKTRRHPSAKQFIDKTQSGIDTIKLSDTLSMLKIAVDKIKEVQATGKAILFVGVKPEIRPLIRQIALSINEPYVTERFIGGSLTNFPQIKKRIEKLHDLLSKKEHGELSMYTKKEQLLIERDIARLDKNFGGMSSMTNLPGAIVMIDSRHEDMALTEANITGVPVISLSNTDCDIAKISHPVIGNDGSIASVQYFLEVIKTALQK